MPTPFKATHSIDLPTGEEFLCDRHAEVVRKKNSFMMHGFAPEKLPAKAKPQSCLSCITESRAKRR